MKKGRGGGRSVKRPRTSLKIQKVPMLDVLLKIKMDAVAATWCHGHTIAFAIAGLRVKNIGEDKERWERNSWLNIPL